MKRTHYYRNLLSALALALAFAAPAQNYPLQITAQLAPPFSGYVPDYGVPGEEKLKLLCLFTDFTQPSYNYKLKVRITGQGVTLQSKPYYFAGPFNITPGMPVQLSGADLSGLLNTNNLDFSGITVADYNLRKVLPEGFYSICVTAYDFNNPVPIQVSNEACAFAWFTLSDPPLLNLPQCSTTLSVTTPQQITFQWTPMNMSSPNSFLNTEYVFSLYEIFPANANPNSIVQTLPPIFQVTLSTTAFNYGITEPPLVLGRQYVWRVQARDITGRDLFRNNGFSQVCTFTYGNIYGNLLNLTLHAQPLTHHTARLWWDSITTFQSYRLEYRKANGNWNWFGVTTAKASSLVADLEPNTDYEAHVNGTTNENYTSGWSNTVTFHTPPAPVINCGDQPVPVNLQNFHPLTSAAQGSIFQVGQFELLVSQLQNTQSLNGTYSGLGRVVLPLAGINVRCSFSNITVDENHIVLTGQVVALSDGIDNWLEQWQSNYTYDNSFCCSCDIDSIYVNSYGQIIIVCQDGNTIIVPDDGVGGLLVTDGNGDQWIVNENGTVVPVEGGALLPVTHDTLTIAEMDILKAAMQKIKSEYTTGKLSELITNKNNNEADYTSYIDNERQPFSVSGQQQWDGETYYIGSADADSLLTGEGITKESQFKASEMSYLEGKVLFIMANNIVTNDQFNFIGTYLTVNNKTFKKYVEDETAAGKTAEQIAEATAQLGIKHLAKLVVSAKMN
jgi:hypothetical protein